MTTLRQQAAADFAAAVAALGERVTLWMPDGARPAAIPPALSGCALTVIFSDGPRDASLGMSDHVSPGPSFDFAPAHRPDLDRGWRVRRENGEEYEVVTVNPSAHNVRARALIRRVRVAC